MAARKETKHPDHHSRRQFARLVGALGLMAIALTGLWLLFFSPDRNKPGSPEEAASSGEQATEPGIAIEPESETYSRYAGSQSCRECHPDAYREWRDSHHGLAERPIDPQRDDEHFAPPRSVEQEAETTTIHKEDGRHTIVTPDADGEKRSFPVERVIGTEPLKQFLVPTEAGRYQATELAVDPHKGDWFNVFGDENRQPGEWGHWTGRGMNWNSMCASCHNTRLRKNYDPEADAYDTVMAEMGVSCESCHGPMREHVDWQFDYADDPNATADPTLTDESPEQRLAVCASCHSRRSELTGDFHPGEAYLDHYSPVIPDERDLYHADGQINDENYVYTSFISSKMYAAGVSCMDCHEPHSATTVLKGNDLCMQCHSGQMADSPVIDPQAHSHHTPGAPGGRCVDCHMPQTTFMQRDPRRDHGFTIPDPQLTREHGIPNACNRCHEDRSTDWAIETTEAWYGDSMERPGRDRARWIARAREGDSEAVGHLQDMVGEEEIPLWRASAANLLERWSRTPEVMETLLEAINDPSPLVRGAAAQSLESAAEQGTAEVRGALEERLHDPRRKVRIDAAWALRSSLDADSPVMDELAHYLDFNADQPSGAMQKGVFLYDRGESQKSLEYLRRAVEWDPNSAPIRHALAVNLSSLGRAREAVNQLQVAVDLAPREADYHYRLGLAYNEAGRLQQAIQALEQAVEIDPQYARAWYNLGLGYSSAGNPQKALDALLKAESINEASPRIPYARATVLVRMGRIQEARQAAERALEIAPDYQSAARLLRKLQAAPAPPTRRLPR